MSSTITTGDMAMMMVPSSIGSGFLVIVKNGDTVVSQPIDKLGSEPVTLIAICYCTLGVDDRAVVAKEGASHLIQ